jgi:Kdo2-lipid IVA lauroyltransferase/acyltransferase
LWSPRLTRKNFRHYIEVENFDETTRSTLPAIVATYHYSNFEWISLACGFFDFTATIMSQKFKNDRLDSIFQRLREQSGHQFIPTERGIIRVYRVLRRKGRTALLIDLSVPPRQGAVVTNCFGLKTSVTSAHAWLCQQTGAAIIPMHCEPLPHGRYRLIFHPTIVLTGKTTLQEFAQKCWDTFEPYVRKNPAPWLWMYKQWRYKPRKPDRAYPFYAHSWKAFERLLAGEMPKSAATPTESDSEAAFDNDLR